MLKASFFAPSFRRFWQNWNPLWSYFLTYYLYKPLSKIFSKSLSIILTFTISGFLHDCVAMLLIHKPSYKMTFLFFLFSVLVLIEKALNFNVSTIPKYFRPVYHSALITLCALLVFAGKII
ncbi:MAG: acyltransferase [Gammaproteobacteria bacterium]|nr:acyltransferase [Gammaproteobacteria bacterium]